MENDRKGWGGGGWGGDRQGTGKSMLTRWSELPFSKVLFIGNGQLSLIFGVPNFCAFSLLVLCLFKLQVEAKKCKNLGHQKLGTVGRFRL